MQIIKYIIGLLIVTSACTYQKSTDNQGAVKKTTPVSDCLTDMLLKADTVLIVGHLGRAYKEPGKNDTLPPIPPILINGKPNFSIIKKQRLITRPQLDTLIGILARPVTEEVGPVKCVFDPHHTIFLINNGVVSYIDLCFACLQFETSNDLKSLVFFDYDKWSELETFFKQMGVRYEQQYRHPK